MLEDLDDLLPRRGSTQCKMGQWMDTLEESDRNILDDALANPVKWSTHALYVALRQKNVDMGYGLIYRHRNGTCRCVANA